MASRVALSPAELDALAGLPYAQVVLYVLGIRPRMDFATGRVGDRPRISWQALTEALYVEPGPGIQGAGSPHKSTVRRACAGLVRAGLVRMISHAEARELRLYLPLADRDADSLARRKPGTKPTQEADTPGRPVGRVTRALPRPEADTPRRPEADTHPDSGRTLPPTAPQAPEGGGGGGLIFPASLKAGQRAELATMLAGEAAAQLVLDELAGSIAAGCAIRAPVRWVRALLARHRAGDLTIDYAHDIAAARSRAAPRTEAPTTAAPVPDELRKLPGEKPSDYFRRMKEHGAIQQGG